MKELHVNYKGIRVLTIIQYIIGIMALVCFIYACTEDAYYEGLRGIYFGVFFSLLFIILLIIPAKRIVLAAEYYISNTERDNEIVEKTEGGDSKVERIIQQGVKKTVDYVVNAGVPDDIKRRMNEEDDETSS